MPTLVEFPTLVWIHGGAEPRPFRARSGPLRAASVDERDEPEQENGCEENPEDDADSESDDVCHAPKTIGRYRRGALDRRPATPHPNGVRPWKVFPGQTSSEQRPRQWSQQAHACD